MKVQKRVLSWLVVFSLLLGMSSLSFADGFGPKVDNDVNFTSDIIYQIVTDRFNDGDVSNNPGGDLFSADKSNLKKYLGGDWKGITDKINDGYLTDLGITAIWISQPVENIYSVLNDALGSTSYHGYWARDFKVANPFFGSMSDFDNLISTAHSHGLKVIIDFAPNHTSPASETDPSYMENGRLYNSGVLVEGYTNDVQNIFHHNLGTDFSTIEDGVYRNLFDLADLNHQNPIVDTMLDEAIGLWLDKGIDGIRVDAVKHMPFGWQKKFMDSIYTHKQVFTFGEWFLSENEVDPANHDFANESGMSLLDFRYAQKLRQVLRNKTADWTDFYQMIVDTQSAYNEVTDQVTFIDNHDMDRFKFAGSDTADVDLALVVTLTSRGVPTIYYGTEQYMEGNGDPNNRAYMTGFNKNTNAYQLIKNISAIRTSNPALAYGNTKERWINGDVFIYERQFGNDVVLVAVNKSDSASYAITGLNTNLKAGSYGDDLAGLMGGNSITVGASGSVTPFDLGPKEAAVWSYAQSDNTPMIGHVGPMMARANQTVTIDGEGFGTSQGTVSVAGTQASILTWTDTQITALVPAVVAGQYAVSVKNSSGVVSNTVGNFEILSGEQTSVRFIVNNAYTAYGENLYLVGNQYELGNWDPSKAIGSMYNKVLMTYPTWYFDVSVPANTSIEFKFIKKDAFGNTTWESGPNHYSTTPSNGVGTINVNYQ